MITRTSYGSTIAALVALMSTERGDRLSLPSSSYLPLPPRPVVPPLVRNERTQSSAGLSREQRRRLKQLERRTQ